MKKFGLLVALTMTCTLAFAQWGDEEMSEKPTLRDRLFFGGGFGAAFSSYNNFISVSPLIGYKITPRLAGGVMVTYRYTSYKNSRPSFSTNDYGASPFLRYKVYGPFFVHAEYEYLNYEYPTQLLPYESVRRKYDSFMAGGGLFQPIGRKAGFFMMALYNFSYQANSPYASPLVLRVGITAGF